jgi:hypothetical protein
MIKLNGKSYFESKDIEEIKKESIFYIHNVIDPDNNGYNYDYLFLCTKEELNLVIFGIESFRNTLMWEFANETAISMSVIDNRFNTSIFPDDLMVSYNDYHLSTKKRTTMDLHKYENWLKTQGTIIFYNFLTKYNK